MGWPLDPFPRHADDFHADIKLSYRRNVGFHYLAKPAGQFGPDRRADRPFEVVIPAVTVRRTPESWAIHGWTAVPTTR